MKFNIYGENKNALQKPKNQAPSNYIDLSDMSDNARLKIIEFHKIIDSYWTTLNTRSIWLFTATLGCSGLENSWNKAFAFLITLLLFFNQLYQHIIATKSFRRAESDTSEAINNIPDTKQKEKENLLNELDAIRKEKLSLYSTLKANLIYVLCFSFWFVSAGYFYFYEFIQ